MQLTYQKFDLPLKHVFTISRGSVAVQETLIVELAAGGHFGYGEATTNSFYGATIENMSAAIEAVRPVLERDKPDDPLRLIAALDRELPNETYSKFALSALDQAMHDLRLKWLATFQTVVPAKIAARAIQLDRRLSQVAQVKVSQQIPLIP